MTDRDLMGALTTLRSVFKAVAEATKRKKKTRRNLVPPLIFVKTGRKEEEEEGSARPEGPTQTDLCVRWCSPLVGWGH